MMSRLIDADALKDWLEIVPLTGDGGVDINDLVEHIDSMPTASDWDRYSTKLWREAYERGKRDATQPNTPNALETLDCVSRKAALDGADKIIERDTSGNNDVVKAMQAWKVWIMALPTAQPERMRGRLLNEDELRDLSVTLDGLITYLGSIAQDVVGATHYRHRVNEMLIMLMKEGEE